MPLLVVLPVSEVLFCWLAWQVLLCESQFVSDFSDKLTWYVCREFFSQLLDLQRFESWAFLCWLYFFFPTSGSLSPIINTATQHNVVLSLSTLLEFSWNFLLPFSIILEVYWATAMIMHRSLVLKCWGKKIRLQFQCM